LKDIHTSQADFVDFPSYHCGWFCEGNMPSELLVLLSPLPVTVNNASDYQANGLLSDYIGWTNGLSDYRANGLGLG